MEEEKGVERRHDIGSKIVWGVLLAAVLGFAGVAWATAVMGGNKADVAITMVNEDRQKNTERLTRLETQFHSVLSKLEAIDRSTDNITKSMDEIKRMLPRIIR